MKKIILASLVCLASVACSVHKKADPVPMPSCPPCVCPVPTDPVPLPEFSHLPLPSAGCRCKVEKRSK